MTSLAEASFAVDELGSALKVHLAVKDGQDDPPQKPAASTKPSKAPAQQQPPSGDEPKKQGGGYDRWTLKDESTLDYGYFGAAQPGDIDTSIQDDDNDPDAFYYITTAINYTNGPAHMGHAYEATTADVIARYHRVTGRHKGGVFFLTGTDEHGQKIATTAAEAQQAPIDICNKYSTGFRVLNQRLLISNDDYVRTTMDRHKRTAQALWQKCAHDIYLDTYTGWYNVKEETFVTDSDAQLWDYKDPATGNPLKKVNEESYFFKMSRYKDRLIAHIEANPTCIQPDMHRNLILQRLKSDDLRDLSISRTTFDWGVPVPAGFKEKHVMYVWVDALSNYLTGVNGLGVVENAKMEGLSKFWPANNHVIGKDILWFHTVIWPSLLMSAQLPLPQTVYAHGFVNDAQGKKMSKSVGNVVDPHDMLDEFDVDSFRWYLCKEAPYGGELSFSRQNMLEMHNADLCDNIGNCVNRATSLTGRFCGDQGVLPDVPPPERPPIDWKSLVKEYQAKMDAHELQGGCQVAAKGFSDLNGWLQEEAPWAKKGDEFAVYRQSIVRGALEAIYALAHLLLPVLPVSGKAIFAKLGTPPRTLRQLDPALRHLEAGTVIDVRAGAVLYEKLLTEEEKKQAATQKKNDYAESKRKKEAAKAKAKAASGSDPNQAEFTKLDIRVGQIRKVWNHESADKLFCEQIDVGAESGGLREICSGLRDHYTLEQLQDQYVLVICNLKPSKMLGFESNGMVLAAKGTDKVELIQPPAGSQIGERVVIKDLPEGAPISAAQVKKRKVLETLAPDWKTIEGGVAAWKGMAMETSAGPCRAATLEQAAIS